MVEHWIGHNAAGIDITVEVRLFNSTARFADNGSTHTRLRLPAGSDVGDVIRHFGIPAREIFLVFVNGTDITPSLYADLRTDRVLDEGDVVALSGPVPYSWGYGSPVV